MCWLALFSPFLFVDFAVDYGRAVKPWLSYKLVSFSTPPVKLFFAANWVNFFCNRWLGELYQEPSAITNLPKQSVHVIQGGRWHLIQRMSSLRPFAFWASWTRRRNYWTDIPPPHHTSRSGNSSLSTPIKWVQPELLIHLSVLTIRSSLYVPPSCPAWAQFSLYTSHQCNCCICVPPPVPKPREIRFDYALGNKELRLAQCARRMASAAQTSQCGTN